MAGRKGHSIHRDWRFSAGWQLYFQVKVRQRRKISCGICSKNVYSLIQLTKYSQEKIVAEVRTVHKKSTSQDLLFLYLSDDPTGILFSFHSNFPSCFWNHHKLNKLLNKKSAIELKFAKSDEQKAKNCTVWREEKGIRGRPKGREKSVEKEKIA